MLNYDPSKLQAEVDKHKTKYIKRFFDGRYMKFAIIDSISDYENGYVALKEVETNDMYDGMIQNGRIEVTSKAEMIYPQSIEEYYYLRYGKRI